MASESTTRTYTVERADGHITTVKLQYRTLVIGWSETTNDWDAGDDLSALHADPGMRIVEGDRDEAVGEVELRVRDGGRSIIASADAVSQCLDVEPNDDVAVYDDDGDLRVVQSRSDPILKLEQRGEW